MDTSDFEFKLVESGITYDGEEEQLFGITGINASACGFKGDKDTINVPAATYQKGQRYSTPRLKNKDRVAIKGFRVANSVGSAKIRISYHKAGWQIGTELVFGSTQESYDICWRNPHRRTPDVMIEIEFLENTEVIPFSIEFQND